MNAINYDLFILQLSTETPRSQRPIQQEWYEEMSKSRLTHVLTVFPCLKMIKFFSLNREQTWDEQRIIHFENLLFPFTKQIHHENYKH